MTLETAIINTTKEVTLNVTNHVVNHLPNDTINVSVQTGDSSILNAILAFSTLGIAIFSFLTLYYSRKGIETSNSATIESNKLTRIELEARTSPFFYVKNWMLSRMTTSEQTRFTTKLTAQLFNGGTVNGYNLKFYSIPIFQSITLKYLIENENEIKQHSISIPFSNLSQNYQENISVDYSFDIEPQIESWIILWIEYAFLNEFKGERAFVVHFKGSSRINEDVYDNHMLDLERKIQKKI